MEYLTDYCFSLHGTYIKSLSKFLTQVWGSYAFDAFKEIIIINNKKLVICMIKFLQKSDYYLSLLRVAHCVFLRVEITCGVNEKQLVL